MERRKLQKGLVDDLVLLETLSEDGIVANLQATAKVDRIYTWIGPVLISVNPFRQIAGLYTPELIRKYRGRYAWELAPHVYAVAEDTYRALMSSHLNQCILITGESGAGKTEAAKKVMEYVAAVSPVVAASDVNVKDRLLQSNPVLEAFGNAKTIRNNNSSRFGKYMELVFDYHGRPVGGRITNYLLEKPRVVAPAPSERSFHVFYLLLAGATEPESAELQLRPAESYKLLMKSGCLTVAGVSDTDEYIAMRHAMELIGFSTAEQMDVMRLVAAILSLQDMHFAPGGSAGSKAYVVAREAEKTLQTTAALLSVEPSVLQGALTHRTITTGAGESIRSPLVSAEECVDTMHALSRSAYARMFSSLVERLNVAIEPPKGAELTMGVLDIYGFEIFEVNSFEQLCINYANEKLQQVFIELTLKAEQEEYAAEGIEWTAIEYFNNQTVCELIEGRRPAGVLAFLDEESIMPKGDDTTFYTKMTKQLATHAHLALPSAAQLRDASSLKELLLFTIRHYAGDVDYSAKGLLEKNKDALYPDLLQCAGTSKSAYVTSLFPEAKEKARAGKRPVTAATQFRVSMSELVATLGKCAPHYIRTIKPNDDKRAGAYDVDRMKHQVRYLGLLENVRVRRAGFAFRQPIKLFADRFRVLSPRTWPTSQFAGEARREAETILSESAIGSDAFKFGKTKLFIRKPLTLFTLEELRVRKLHDVARMLQTGWRSYLARKYFLELREQAMGIFAGQKRRRGSWALYFLGDYIRAQESAELTRTLTKHSERRIFFADVAEKVNRKKKPQKRALVITEGALYTMTPAFKTTNRVPLEAILGVACSTFADGYFVLKVAPGTKDVPADLLLSSVRKAEIMTILSRELHERGRELAFTFADEITFRSKRPGGLFGGGAVESRTLTFDEDLSLGAHAAVAELLESQGPTGPIAIRGVFNFQASSSDQLSFNVGALMHIVEKNDLEWWMAELDGKVGLVPANHVKML